MEQWEKEYIDFVMKAKCGKEEGKVVDCSYEEGYDSSKWIEIKNTDGTRYYVPRKSGFDDQQHGKHKKNPIRTSPGNRKVLKLFVRIVLAIVLLRGFLLHYGYNRIQNVDFVKVSNPISLQGFIQGKLLGGSYINGRGFADMMRFFKDMQEERHLFLEDIAEHIDSLSEVNVEQWTQVMKEREDRLGKLKYANSYQEYVNAQKQVFEQQKELLTLVKHETAVHTILEMYYQIANADFSLRSKEIEALEKNGIDYHVDQNGLTYWYSNY